MKFKIISRSKLPHAATNAGFLISDSWNDYFKFITLFHLFVFDAKGKKYEIGSLKIGQFGMKEEPNVMASPDIPGDFESLDDSLFSLGQEEGYYENLNALGPELRSEILVCLKDVAFDEVLFERARLEPVMTSSLMRGFQVETVRGQLRRLAKGGARLSHFKFSYTGKKHGDEPPLNLQFGIVPETIPPTNVHVLIGRNGVGKTQLLNHMSRALIHGDASSEEYGKFLFESVDQPNEIAKFVNLVSVTFSAFDPFEAPETGNQDQSIEYSYVGLKFPKEISRKGEMEMSDFHPVQPKAALVKNIDDLAEDFEKSMAECRVGARNDRWRQALEVLSSDPLFAEADVTSLADSASDSKSVKSLFRRLSSGHKIVLLTITRLVEHVDEKTLVLIDEPEAYLHPPLLSSFIRALSNLLMDRNGVAIVATHSPVVLQEVPKTCVWKLRRSGNSAKADRPNIETFGENVGVLTRDVFGLEVTKSGFHRMIERAAASTNHFDIALDQLGNSLGSEALAILRGLIAEKVR